MSRIPNLRDGGTTRRWQICRKFTGRHRLDLASAARLRSEADMNRVVLVTGACGGIGSVLCRRFVEQGDTVLALDLDAAALQALSAQLGDAHVTPVAVDLCDAAAVQQAVAQAVSTRGP